MRGAGYPGLCAETAQAGYRSGGVVALPGIEINRIPVRQSQSQLISQLGVYKKGQARFVSLAFLFKHQSSLTY
jgi:hypothetical protein